MPVFAQTVAPVRKGIPLFLYILIFPFTLSNETLKFSFLISLFAFPVKKDPAAAPSAMAIEDPKREAAFIKSRRFTGPAMFNLLVDTNFLYVSRRVIDTGISNRSCIQTKVLFRC